MTPDELVNAIIHIQSGGHPGRGGDGDLTIEIQDDMPLVEVAQGDQTLGLGSTIQKALEAALVNVKRKSGQ